MLMTLPAGAAAGPAGPVPPWWPRGSQAAPPPLAPVTRINGGSDARFKPPVLDPAHRGADAGEPLVRPHARLPLHRQRERVPGRAALRPADRERVEPRIFRCAGDRVQDRTHDP